MGPESPTITMKRKIFILWLVLLCTGVSRLMAQVTVDVKIDSLQLLIGQQTGITLSCHAMQTNIPCCPPSRTAVS